MKRALFILGMLWGCNPVPKEEPFKPEFIVIEYTYDSGWDNAAAFSIQLHQDGLVFLSRNRHEPRKFYQSQLSKAQIRTLSRLVSNCSPGSLQPKYEQKGLSDGEQYRVWLLLPDRVRNRVKKVDVYGDKEPASLDSLQKGLHDLEEALAFTATAKPIKFESREGFYPPPVQLRTKKFVPPED